MNKNLHMISRIRTVFSDKLKRRSAFFILFSSLGLNLGYAQRDLIISGGNTVSSFVCNNNQAYVWGNINGTPVTSPQLVTVGSPAVTVQQINSGSGATFVALDCNDNVWAWGNNKFGQAGIGSTSAWVTTPTRVKAAATIAASNRDASGNLTNVSVVYGGNNNSYAILKDGSLVAWGHNSSSGSGGSWDNNNGQLGDGTTTDQTAAVYVKKCSGGNLTGATQIFAGDNVTYALVGGTVYSWGNGLFGGLGRNAAGTGNPKSNADVQSSCAAPVLHGDGTPLSNIVQISASDVMGMALDADGYVWTWGNGGWNNVTANNMDGTGKPQPPLINSVPARVLAFKTTGASNDGKYLLAKQIGGGQGFAMAVTVDGRPVAWGGGGCGAGGATGNGTTTGNASIGVDYIQYGPGQVHSDVTQINRGDEWGFYVRSDNTVWAWGCNTGGVLGLGNTTNQDYAKQITPPVGCGFRDPAPDILLTKTAVTGAKTRGDTTVCASKFTSLQLNSGFVTSIGASYTVNWYKDNGAVPVKTGTATVAGALNYTATLPGKYNVEISYTGANGGCATYPVVKDSLTISTHPKTFDVPTNLTYCGTTATVNVNSTSTTKPRYDWFNTTSSTPVLGSSITSGTTTIDISGATAGAGTDKIVYVEEKSYATGTVLKKNQGCDPTWFASSDNMNAGNITDNTQSGFTVTEAITINTLSMMLESDIYNVGNSYGGTINFAIYGNKTVNNGLVADATKQIGTFSYTFSRTRGATDPQTVRVEDTVDVNIKLPAAGTYFISMQSFTGVTGSGGLKVGRGGCAQSVPVVDDVNGGLMTYSGMSQAFSNPQTGANITQGRFFNVGFKTEQKYCDRIPVTIKQLCPCQQPASVTATSAPAPVAATATVAKTVTVCAGTPINLTGTFVAGTNPLTSTLQHVWYKKGTAPGAYTANPIVAKALTGVAADAGIWVLRVEDGNAGTASCYKEDSVKVIVHQPVVKGAIAAHQTYCGTTIPAALTSTTAASGGTGTYTYEWQSSATGAAASWAAAAPAGALATYAPPSLATTTYYRRKVTSGVCPVVFTDSVRITINTIPANPPKPTTPTNPACSTAVLTEAAATAPVAYFWQAARLDSSKTDNASITKTVTASGTYYVRAKNTTSHCWSTGSDSIVMIIDAPNLRGAIARHQSNCGGTGALFTPTLLTDSISATGGNGTSRTYEWQTSATGAAASWTPIPAATNATYQPPGLSATTYYRRKVTSGVCPAVFTDSVKISIGTIPADPTAITGASPACPTSTLTIAAAPANVAYYWQGTTAVGTKVDSIGTTPYTVTGSGTYYARALNTVSGCWSLGSVNIPIVINSLNAGAIAAPEIVCESKIPATITSTTAASGGSGTITYQWQSSADSLAWTDINGETAATLAFSTPITASAYYRRKVSSGSCDNFTPGVKKTFSPLPLAAGAITGSGSVCENTTGNIYSIAAVTNATSYDWTVPTGASITAGDQTTTITVTFGNTSGNVEVVPRNTCGVGPKATLPVTVNPMITPTVVIQGPDSICANENANFFIKTESDGGNAPTYKWYVGATEQIGFTGQAFNSTALVNGDQITVVMVTSKVCPTAPSVTSNIWNIKVVDKVTPGVTITPTSVCAGVSQTITAYPVAGGSAPTYDWTLNGAAVGSGLSNTFTSSGFNNGDVIAVMMTSNSSCAAPTKFANDTKTLVVKPRPVATANDPVICSGAQADINLTSTITGTTFDWTTTADPDVTGISTAGATLTGNDKISQVLTLAGTVVSPKIISYKITPTADLCSGPAITQTITVNPIPTILATGTSICSNNSPAINLSSNVVTATFNWLGTNGNNISGAGAVGSANPIADVLVNGGKAASNATYGIVAVANACTTAVPTIVTVIVKPIPVASGSNPAICGNKQTDITLTNDITTPGAVSTYAWTATGSSASVGGYSASGTANPIKETLTNNGTVDETVTYSVIPTVDGCDGTATPVAVTVKPIPVAIASGLAAICGGNPTRIRATSGVTGTTFTWAMTVNPGGGTVTGAASGTVAADSINEVLTNISSAPGTAKYTITPTANSCVGADVTVSVIVNPAPNVFATGHSICSGAATNIPISTGTTGMTVAYAWTSAVTTGTMTGQNALGGSSNPIVETLTNTGSANAVITYTVTPTANGCTGASDTAVVTVKPIPVATSVNIKPIICSGEVTSIDISSLTTTATFDITPTGGAGSSGISSMPNPGSVLQTLSASAQTKVKYMIMPKADGCPGLAIYDSVIVHQIPVSEAGTASKFCVGDSAMIGVTSNSIYSYKWTPSAGLESDTLSNPETKATGSTMYIVTTILKANTTCQSKDSVQITVAPKFTVDAGPDVLICAKDPVKLTASPSGLVSYVWSNGAAGKTIDVAPEDTTVYILIADNGGCQAMDTVIVNVKNIANPTLFIPNSFTPNGDTRNDVFKASGEGVVEFEGQIFNRWGELFYSWTAMEEGWDGTLIDGSMALEDVYIYSIRVKNLCDKKFRDPRTGTVTIIK